MGEKGQQHQKERKNNAAQKKETASKPPDNLTLG